MMESMVIDMNDQQLATLAQLRAFLEGTTAVDFAVAADQRYDFITRTLQRFGYRRLPRSGKGVVLRFLERVSGYSRQQLTRLVKRGGGPRPLAQALLALPGPALRAPLRAPTCACSRTPILCTARCRVWPPKSSWSAPMASSATSATSAWP